eukprot:scaffold2657_cov368-Pavlova_lutheri.AAC.7
MTDRSNSWTGRLNNAGRQHGPGGITTSRMTFEFSIGKRKMLKKKIASIQHHCFLHKNSYWIPDVGSKNCSTLENWESEGRGPCRRSMRLCNGCGILVIHRDWSI